MVLYQKNILTRNAKMKFEEIKALVELVEESSITGLTIEEKDTKIKIEKGGVAIAAAPVAVSAPVAAAAVPVAAPAAAAVEGDVITSPMVGTFYVSPSPDAPPFVTAGSNVSKGSKICIIEAMKIFNEIEAEFDCTILEILVEDGQVVEYDTPLFRVQKK